MPRVRHPRAKALRVSYALTTAWLAALSIGPGVVVNDVAASFTGFVLLSFSLALSAMFADRAELLPSGGALTPRESLVLRWLLAAAVLGAVALVIEGAANQGATSRAVFGVTLAAALVLGVVSLAMLLRAERP